MESANQISYNFCKIDGANIISHEEKFANEPSWGHLCETIGNVFNITVRNYYELSYRTTERPRNLLNGQVTLDHMINKLNDIAVVRRILITPLRTPPSVQVPAIMRTSSLHFGQFVTNRLVHNRYLHQVASQKNKTLISKAIENPTDQQLLMWVKQNPDIEAKFNLTNVSDPSQLSFAILQRLRQLYSVCVQNWHKKNSKKPG